MSSLIFISRVHTFESIEVLELKIKKIQGLENP